MNAHTAAGDGIKIDLEGHLIIRDSQTKQTAYGALIVAFADAQNGTSDQRGE
ncbi:hypothetical protein D3C85_1035530 [compost metagenome]